MPFRMVVGNAYRIRRYDESGPPEVVVVDKKIVERARYNGDARWYDEQCMIVFVDPKTKEHYMQVQPE